MIAAAYRYKTILKNTKHFIERGPRLKLCVYNLIGNYCIFFLKKFLFLLNNAYVQFYPKIFDIEFVGSKTISTPIRTRVNFNNFQLTISFLFYRQHMYCLGSMSLFFNHLYTWKISIIIIRYFKTAWATLSTSKIKEISSANISVCSQ